MSLSRAASTLNADVWHVTIDSTGNEKAYCQLCNDSLGRDIRNAKQHEKSSKHQTLALAQQVPPPSLAAQALESTQSLPCSSEQPVPAVPILSPLDVAGTNLLYSFLPAGQRPKPLPLPDTTPDPITNYLNDYWKSAEESGETGMQSPQQTGITLIAQAIMDLMERGPDTIPLDDEADERSDEEEDVQPDDPDVLEHSRKRRRTQARDIFDPYNEWFPWPDRISCTLDIFMHLSRSAFSQHQLDLFLWLLEANQVDNLPSVSSTKKLNDALQKLCGVDSIRYEGALGHRYYVNSLSQIIAQEMSNPQIRPLLEFYPEDSSKHLSEACQAARWLNEAPDDQLTPMLRLQDGEDYYIHEPMMLRDGVVCMPYRWFKRNNKHFACCWQMQTCVNETNVVWRVLKVDGYEVSEDEILKKFPELCKDAEQIYNLPHPTLIDSVCEDIHKPEVLLAWTLTDPKTESQKDYNVHFLCMSNIAPPLEMLDGIVEQLEEAQDNGIWAWDCHFNEAVLVIPMVLAMLGDNPMQSEFACHIGLRGKYFCRICWVKGKDANESRPAGHTANIPDDVWQVDSADSDSDDGHDGGSDDGQSAKGTKPKGHSKLLESFEAMKRHVNVPRTKEETMDKLRSQFVEAQILGMGNKIKSMRTDSGLKDTFASFFIDKLINSYKAKRGDQRQEALDKAISEMHEEILRLDLHSDTPVEILHVVLLGFVKYLWCDVVHNQLSKNEAKKCQLMVCLSSVDVEGMGLPPLAGHTLVTYCGSLTGRDFWAIAQVAPFVLQDFVQDDCYQMWVAFSKLVPLIWQPEIKDIDAYVVLLQKEIDCFLQCVAVWTCWWFNKPKFHILVHLPEHIRRFGPAMLFATEAFELFNARNKWTTIAKRALALVAEPSAATEYLGLTAKDTKAEKWGTYSSDGQAACPFLDTKMGSHASSLFGYTNGTPINPMCKTGKNFYLLNHDLCQLREHVVVCGSESNFIGSVEEILQRTVLFGDQVDFILVKAVSLGSTSAHGMPQIEQTTRLSIVPLEDVLCTVNVQHDCIKNGCGAERVVPVRQEGELTLELHEQIIHQWNPQDIVLNTAQMCSAWFIQPFCVNSVPRDTASISSRAPTPSALPRNASLPLSQLNPNRPASTRQSLGYTLEQSSFTHIPSRSNVTHAQSLREPPHYLGEAQFWPIAGSVPIAGPSYSLGDGQFENYNHPSVSPEARQIVHSQDDSRLWTGTTSEPWFPQNMSTPHVTTHLHPHSVTMPPFSVPSRPVNASAEDRMGQGVPFSRQWQYGDHSWPQPDPPL
ncbi:uncharacterized protein ARMOST_20040 [Armillaria ostoyae]|uniref:Uncharacterized protein n=1 Tax=Armillaria ostoyae TaxID=47428 RepID=A0A284S673_ARMOS|nr:uncharacterized protein ARMOST_20040 [Armillaria ostoyae]